MTAPHSIHAKARVSPCKLIDDCSDLSRPYHANNGQFWAYGLEYLQMS